MRRGVFVAGLVLAVLLFATVGLAISLVRSIRSLLARTPSLALERSTAL